MENMMPSWAHYRSPDNASDLLTLKQNLIANPWMSEGMGLCCAFEAPWDEGEFPVPPCNKILLYIHQASHYTPCLAVYYHKYDAEQWLYACEIGEFIDKNIFVEGWPFKDLREGKYLRAKDLVIRDVAFAT